jgi:cytidylate kinase
MESYIEEFQGDHEKSSEIVVTIDGTSGAGKGTLAKHISEKLDIPHYSAGDFFRSLAADKGMSVEELSEKASKVTDVEVDRRTLEKGLNESCVIDGRLPSRVLGDYSDLRIFLTADLGKRAERVARREDIEVDDAEERTEQRDKDNKNRYSDYYRIDTSNLENYDLVVDNSDLSIEEQNELMDKVLKDRFPERYEE